MIEGVKILPLNLEKNKHGHLMEIQRNDDHHYPGFGQAYITMTRPGVVKAWYRHQKQIDQISIIDGNFDLVLYDLETNRLMKIKLSINEPKLVQIPTKIWHGFKNVGGQNGLLLHLNVLPFNKEQPDEDRIAPYSDKIPYKW